MNFIVNSFDIMKANFRRLNVEVTFDEFKELDVAKQLGNYIHANTPDIGLDDVAREIYHSEGEIELEDSYAPAIIELVSMNSCMFIAAVKKAIIKELTKEQ